MPAHDYWWNLAINSHRLLSQGIARESMSIRYSVYNFGCHLEQSQHSPFEANGLADGPSWSDLQNPSHPGAMLETGFGNVPSNRERKQVRRGEGENAVGNHPYAVHTSTNSCIGKRMRSDSFVRYKSGHDSKSGNSHPSISTFSKSIRL
jgi:hypothetical protein